MNKVCPNLIVDKVLVFDEVAQNLCSPVLGGPERVCVIQPSKSHRLGGKGTNKRLFKRKKGSLTVLRS
jgi:hypothetical protein